MSRLTQRLNGLATVVDHLSIRFEYDALGRITYSPSDGGTPRFVLGRAQEGVIWRFCAHLPTELVQGVARLAAREKGIPIALENTRPPERWVMIERKFIAATGESEGAPGKIDVRHELVSYENVPIGEIYSIF